MFTELLEKVMRHEDLTADEAAAAMREVMEGRAAPAALAALLSGLVMKGERPSEIVGFATTMREHAVKLSAPVSDVFDTCGTGGDRSGTFNISSAAAIVVAAWMLNPSVCASMTIGAPQVSLPALSELHQLLMERGLRRSFSDDDRVVEGASNEERVTADPGVQVTAPARHGAGFSADERDQHGRAERGDIASGAHADGGRRHPDRGGRR